MTPEERAEKIAENTDQPPSLTEDLKAEAVLQIRAAVAEEREACALVADGFDNGGWRAPVGAIADAIRARSSQ